MINKTRYLIILIISLLSFTNKEYSKVHSKELNKKQTCTEKKDKIIKPKEIQGIWASSEEENALFNIKGNSIYYVEHPESRVTYEIKKDTFIIYYEGFTTKNIIIKLDADSFIFKTEVDYLNELYKRK